MFHKSFRKVVSRDVMPEDYDVKDYEGPRNERLSWTCGMSITPNNGHALCRMAC